MTTVWSKQHVNVLNVLNDSGRYIVQKQYIISDLQEHAKLVLEVYDWYVKKAAAKYPKPSDVNYPVWVSLSWEGTMLKSTDTVILEMKIPSDLIMPVSISKWGMILNYSYIPQNEQDEKRHRRLLEECNTIDANAYMTPFFPQIKKEITDSWDRLFDDDIVIHNRMEYGTLWELKKEWIVSVTQ